LKTREGTRKGKTVGSPALNCSTFVREQGGRSSEKIKQKKGFDADREERLRGEGCKFREMSNKIEDVELRPLEREPYRTGERESNQ